MMGTPVYALHDLHIWGHEAMLSPSERSTALTDALADCSPTARGEHVPGGKKGLLGQAWPFGRLPLVGMGGGGPNGGGGCACISCNTGSQI